jgi:hypothetical protein
MKSLFALYFLCLSSILPKRVMDAVLINFYLLVNF